MTSGGTTPGRLRSWGGSTITWGLRLGLLLAAAAIATVSRGFAADPVRVAILPPEVTMPNFQTKEDSLAVADYLQGKLVDFPGVEWLERHDLDKLLSETDLAPPGGAGASAIVLGRMLKADVILCGNIESGSWKHDGTPQRQFTAEMNLQVIDATDANILAEQTIELPPFKTGPISPADLEHAATIARGLLTTALAARRSIASGLVLAPVFFANSGASPRLDPWEETWNGALQKEADALKGVKLLRFPGLTQAKQEQKLALLGLTSADPSAWQHAADGYLWGSYHEVPVQKTVAFEDTEVEAELFLQLGPGEPTRIVRQFTVKDFPEASLALAREVVETALQRGHTEKSPDAGAAIAQSIFARLCTLVDGGFFTANPSVENILPPGSQGTGISGHSVTNPIQRLPMPEQKLVYCQRMLELACFFDPANNRLQMLRWTVSHPDFQQWGNPDTQLEPMTECVELMERIAKAPELDVPAFLGCAEAILNRLVYWQRWGGNWFKAGTQVGSIIECPVPGVPARRTALLDIFFGAFTRKLPVVGAYLDREQVPAPRRAFLATWQSIVLQSDTKAEDRLQYLSVSRPLLPSKYDYSPYDERLMKDIGDRTLVQRLLMDIKPAPDGAPGPFVNRVAPPAPAGIQPPTEALLEGVAIREPPWLRRIVLPVQQLSEADGRKFLVNKIGGYGDQLILAGSFLPSFTNNRTEKAALLYQASSGTLQTLEKASPGFVQGDVGRVLYWINWMEQPAGWVDLRTSTRGRFSLGMGLPAANPAVLGFDGAGQAVVADAEAKTVGMFDWKKQQWLTLPAPPPGHAPAPDDGLFSGALRPSPAQAWPAGDSVVFPRLNLVFESETQSWRTLPAGAEMPPEVVPTSNLLRPSVIGESFCIDDQLWSWNPRGLTEFSLSENRVVWHADTQKLLGVCPDGPYVWLLLPSPVAPYRSLPRWFPPVLVLIERASHTVLGAVKLPMDITALYAGDHELWMGVGAGGSMQGENLLRVDKARLYGVLNQPPPISRPNPASQPAAGDTSAGALYGAIVDNDPARLRQLLDQGASANGVAGAGSVPLLQIAAWAGEEEMCRLLLEHGANANAGDGQGWNATAAAASGGDSATLGLLLRSGGKATETALTEALRNADFESADTLIKAGAPIGGVAAVVTQTNNKELAGRLLALSLPLTPSDRTQLAVDAGVIDEAAAAGGDSKQTYELIMQAVFTKQWSTAASIVGAVPAAQWPSDELRNAFELAINFNAIPVVEAFLERGMSAAPTELERSTSSKGPLYGAIRSPETFTLLLQHGADPRALDTPEETFLESVAQGPDPGNMLTALFKYYPELDQRFGYGTLGGSVLCAAVIGYHHLNGPHLDNRPGPYPDTPPGAAGAVQVLLKHGVPPGAFGREGYTALQAAFAVRSPLLACLLAGSGCDLHARDLAGRTIFDAPYLLVGQQYGFVEKLRKYQPISDIETQGKQRLLEAIDARGSYAELFDAVSRNDSVRARALLQKEGSSTLPYAVPGEPEAALARQPGLVFLAVKAGSLNLTRLLLDHHCDPNVGEAGCEYFYANEGKSLLEAKMQPSNGLANQRPQPTSKCELPLIVAAAAGDTAMVDLLLDHGAYAPTTDQFQRNAVDAAATPALADHIRERARLQFEVEKLCSAGTGTTEYRGSAETSQRIAADTPDAFEVENSHGETPLSVLAENLGLTPSWGEWSMGNMDSRSLEVLTVLHKAGLALNAFNGYGVTPLHRAVLYAQQRNIASLLRAGFDPRLPDRHGVTAMELAESLLDPKQRSGVLAVLNGAPVP